MEGFVLQRLVRQMLHPGIYVWRHNFHILRLLVIIMSAFSKAIVHICEELKPVADCQAKQSNRSTLSCLMTMLRPHIAYELDPTKTSGQREAPDSRAKPWSVEVTFWEVSDGLKNGDLLAECEEETVHGMDGVLAVVQGDVVAMHEERIKEAPDIAEFSDISLKRRLGGLRPAISRGGGTATLRIYYSINPSERLLCSVRVTRVKK